jgi:hypothetical protein
MMAPRVRPWRRVLSNPLRKHGDVSRIHTAPLAMLLQGSRHSSDDHVGTPIGLKTLLRWPRRYTYRAQGASPTATLLYVQGSGHFPASHVSSRLHPHCTAGHLLASIKGVSRAPEKGGRKRRRERKGRTCSVRTHRRTEAGRVGEMRYRQPQTSRLNTEPAPPLSLALAFPQRL